MDVALQRNAQQSIIIVMGVSGAGKTTVGSRLAEDLGAVFLEGDELHPAANVEKMRSGVPLTDADRAPWLAALRDCIEAYLAASRMAIVACSALRKRYRDRLRVDPQRVHFVYLRADYELLQQRLQNRREHFMPPSMLKSQIATLEEPADAVVVDAALSVDDIVARIRGALGL